MAYAVTPLIGAFDADINPPAGRTFALGNTYTASDGHVYIYAKASGAIGASVACVLTEPALTMAAGAGAWTSPAVAMVLNDTGWFKKTAI